MNTAARMRDGCKAAVCSASAKTRFALALALALCASLALAAPMAAQPWVANRIAQATNDLARSIPPPDYSPSNVALRATIESVAPAPGDYGTVSNRAIKAVTTNANGTAEIYGRSHALFLHPDTGQIEWEGPDVSAYIGLPKRSGTLVLTDDIPDTDGFFRVDNHSTLPGGSTYFYGTMMYSINLGFEYIANGCNYILPPPEYPEQNVYLASTNYVQKAVATAINVLPTVPDWALQPTKPTYTASEVGATTPADVTAAIREQSLGGIWDEELQVWWTPVMRNGSLTYQATTNVNLNAEN